MGKGIPKHGKRDKNEQEIKDTLKSVGCTVQELSSRDCPDLLVGFRGDNYLLEVKGRFGKLRSGQVEFSILWAGRPPVVVRTPDEALRAVGAID